MKDIAGGKEFEKEEGAKEKGGRTAACKVRGEDGFFDGQNAV